MAEEKKNSDQADSQASQQEVEKKTEGLFKKLFNRVTHSKFISPEINADKIAKIELPSETRDYPDGDWLTRMQEIAGNSVSDTRQLESDRFVRYRDYEQMCLHGDTKIPLLNGSSITIKDWYDNHKNESFYVYSYDVKTNKVVAGLGFGPRITKAEAEVIKIKFNNGETEIVTPDHLFLLTTGEYKRADSIAKGEKIRALTRRISVKSRDGLEDYEMINENGKWEFTHRIIARQLEKDLLSNKSINIHHKDKNKRNNYPNNLEAMSNGKHYHLHIQERIDNSQPALFDVSKFNNSDTNLDNKINGYEEIYIIEVERLKEVEKNVYDISVQEYNNFAIGSGIFVHNCFDALIGGFVETYADEMTQKDEKGNVLTIKSKDKKTERLTKELFFEKIKLNETLWKIAYEMCKYGDTFYEIIFNKKLDDILYLKFVSPYKIWRIEKEGKLKGFRYSPTEVNVNVTRESEVLKSMGVNTEEKLIEPFKIINFRIEDNKYAPFGRCLKWDTYVETVNGPKFIKDIEIGDKVYCFDLKTHSKKTTEVLNKVCSGNKNIIKIKTQHFSIEGSEEHNVLTIKDNEFIYRPISELKLKDILVSNIDNQDVNLSILINKDLSDCGVNWNDWRKNINLIPNSMTDDFARLFGFMLGDGWINNNNVCIALGVDEENNKKYIDLLEKFSGQKSIKIRPYKSLPNRVLEFSQAVVGSKMLKNILIKNGFYGKVYTKRFPNWIWRAPKNIQMAFLEGLMDADGYEARPDKWGIIRNNLELANEYLVKDAKYLLQILGYKCGNVTSRNRGFVDFGDGKLRERRTSYFINFFMSKITQSKLYDLVDRKSEHFVYEPILSIENTETEELVYDIQVKDNNNNFYANNIVVHNSILDSSRSTWKQLKLLEDATIIYRLARAPVRRVWTVDVGQLSHEKGIEYIKRVKDSLNKKTIIDPTTGKIVDAKKAISMVEDFWIPSRAGQASSQVTELGGQPKLGEGIDDLQWFREKVMFNLRIPRAWVNDDTLRTSGKALATIDVNFAKAIEKVQTFVEAGLYKIAYIYLIIKGIPPDKIKSLKIQLTPPSMYKESSKFEFLTNKFNLMTSITQSQLFPSVFILKEYFGLSDEEIIAIIGLNQAQQAGADMLSILTGKPSPFIQGQAGAGGVPPAEQGMPGQPGAAPGGAGTPEQQMQAGLGAPPGGEQPAGGELGAEAPAGATEQQAGTTPPEEAPTETPRSQTPTPPSRQPQFAIMSPADLALKALLNLESKKINAKTKEEFIMEAQKTMIEAIEDSRDLITEKQMALLNILKQKTFDEGSQNTFLGSVSSGDLNGLRERIKEKNGEIIVDGKKAEDNANEFSRLLNEKEKEKEREIGQQTMVYPDSEKKDKFMSDLARREENNKNR